MFTINDKVPYDPHLVSLTEVPEALKPLLLRLNEVLTAHAAAINGSDVWEDLVVGATSVHGGSVSPTFNTDTLTDDYSFAAANDVVFVYQLPHAWKEGTGLRFHAHCYLASAPATNNTSRWDLIYVYYDEKGEVIPDLTVAGNWTTVSLTHTHPATARESDVIVFPEIVPTGKHGSMILKVRLKRQPAHAEDIVSQVVKIDSYDIHYQRNTAGSRREYVK